MPSDSHNPLPAAHARNEGPGGCVPWETFMVLMGAAKAAEAEVERLRAALEAILNEFDPGENDPVARLAREALEAGER